MVDFVAFAETRNEPESPRRKRKAPWDKHDSIALIASNGLVGCILAYDGTGIEADIEALGSGCVLSDHGLDNAPEGLSIWEGRLDAWTTNTPENGIDYNAQLEGEFRDLSDQEWELLRTTGTPWLFEDGDDSASNRVDAEQS